MIKKILVLFCAFLFSLKGSANDYSSYCEPKEPQGSLGGDILSLSGINSINRNIIENQIARALKKETGAKFKVNIESFWGVNVLNGEFKSFSAKTDSYSYKGLYGSNLTLETICPYNKVNYKDKKLTFDKTAVLKYSTEITQNDLDKIISSSAYQKLIDKINNDKILSSLIKIETASAKIKNDRLVFKYEIAPFKKFDLTYLTKGVIKPIDLVFSANLKVEDNKLALCDIDVNSIKVNYDKFLPLINSLNPLSYDYKISKNTKADLKLESAGIRDSKINLEGFVIIPKK